jgi:hypothetical protein
MRIQVTNGALLFVVLAACGCQGASRHGSVADSAATSSSGPATRPKPELTAMPMLPGLRAHLDSVAANPSMLRSSMSGHLAEVKAVVDAMHADMMAAGMHSDAAYEALADSVVKSSEALGTASGPEFKRLVAEHVDQIRRLAAVYETKAAAM